MKTINVYRRSGIRTNIPHGYLLLCSPPLGSLRIKPLVKLSKSRAMHESSVNAWLHDRHAVNLPISSSSLLQFCTNPSQLAGLVQPSG
jgi:hypothetical protein